MIITLLLLIIIIRIIIIIITIILIIIGILRWHRPLSFCMLDLAACLLAFPQRNTIYYNIVFDILY